MPVSKNAYSQDGTVNEYTLANNKGNKLQVSTFGARITKFIFKDKDGKDRDLVPGFDSHEKWLDSFKIDDPFFGSTVGRVAGRIYPCDDVTIAGKKCILPEIQPNKVCLHGGKVGFDKRIFAAKIISESPPSVEFSYTSADGEEGFPGSVELRVKYTLTEDNAVDIDYKGKLLSGSETVLNPTNHTYWNLTGFEEPTVHNHMCKLNAEQYMATMPNHIMVPTGEFAQVKGTPLDFTSPRRFGDEMDKFDKDGVRGYDHIFVTANAPVAQTREVAQVWSDKSNIRMTVHTDQPVAVLYTGNWISDKLVGKRNIRYGNYAAFAIETQRFPNAVNIPKLRDQVMLSPGQEFTHHTMYHFENMA